MQSQLTTNPEAAYANAQSTLLEVLSQAASRIQSRMKAEPEAELTRIDLTTLAQLYRVLAMRDRQQLRDSKNQAKHDTAQKRRAEITADFEKLETVLAQLDAMDEAEAHESEASITTSEAQSSAPSAPQVPFRHALSKAKRSAQRRAEKKAKRQMVSV